MSDYTPYTPSEKMVRRGWIDYRVAQDEADAWVISEDDSPVAEFDRFIAKVKRDAAREALDALEEFIRTDMDEPHGDRAASRVWGFRDTHYPEDVAP